MISVPNPPGLLNGNRLFDLKSYINHKKDLIEDYLKEYFSRRFKPDKLYDSITYSLFAGGKRIRPILCIASYEACGGRAEDILPQASAIELIHTYSLIHDDLPAMDDDDLRRGKPTNHKVFGEAIAILAGDGLLTEAFVMFTENNLVPSDRKLRALRLLAEAAGVRGMVGGQAEDILSEGMPPEPERLEFIHTHKTGALLSASVKIAPILYGSDSKILQMLSGYGENIGLAFQIVDDILDIVGSEEKIGKKTKADIEKKKMTYPALYGIEKSKEMAERLICKAIESVSFLGESSRALREIAQYLLVRVE